MAKTNNNHLATKYKRFYWSKHKHSTKCQYAHYWEYDMVTQECRYALAGLKAQTLILKGCLHLGFIFGLLPFPWKRSLCGAPTRSCFHLWRCHPSNSLRSWGYVGRKLAGKLGLPLELVGSIWARISFMSWWMSVHHSPLS